jgi:hypothetical protein
LGSPEQLLAATANIDTTTEDIQIECIWYNLGTTRINAAQGSPEQVLAAAGKMPHSKYGSHTM